MTEASSPPLRYATHASSVLREAITGAPGETVTLSALVDGLRGRAYGLFFILLALGNCAPAPPGTGGIFGIPLLFLAAQAAAGRAMPRLPRVIGRLGLKKTTALKTLDRIMPLLTTIENRFRPRFETLARGSWERAAAIVICMLAVAMSLPVPFTNFPPAAATLVIALGLFERDGLAVMIGWACAVVAIYVVAWAVSIYLTSIILLLEQLVI